MAQTPGTYDLSRRALEYILERMAEERAQGKKADRARLLDEAGMRFNLSPADTASLARLLAESPDARLER